MSLYPQFARPQPIARKTTLRFEQLEDRDVPSAVVDLTTHGAQQYVNGALFQQFDARPTGTGVIDSFVRVQAQGNKTVEQGYNTDARPLQFDENSSPQFTRSIHVGDLPLVNKDGTEYREILLDINQKASSPLLSLDELRVYVGGAGNLKGYANGTLANMAPVYDLDAGGDSWVKLNARLNTGSGSGDMLFYVRNDVLGGAGNFLYLYSKFGAQGGAYAANGGFEEWAAGVGGASVSPDSASITGFVINGNSGAPVSGIISATVDGVVLDDVVIGSDGSYTINNLILTNPTANVVLVVTSDSGQTQQFVFSIIPGENTVDLKMFFE